MSLEELRRFLEVTNKGENLPSVEVRSTEKNPPKKMKKPRKPSKYNKKLGKHLEALKKKHPRTDVTKLMKKAHRLTKKEMSK